MVQSTGRKTSQCVTVEELFHVAIELGSAKCVFGRVVEGDGLLLRFGDLRPSELVKHELDSAGLVGEAAGAEAAQGLVADHRIGEPEVPGVFVAQVEREGVHQVFREAPGIAGDVMADAVHHEDLELAAGRAAVDKRL